MNKKIDNLKELEYYGNFNLVGEVLLKLKNIQITKHYVIRYAMQEVGFYVNELQRNQYHFNESLSQYRSDKIRAVVRARKCEKELESLKKCTESNQVKKSNERKCIIKNAKDIKNITITLSVIIERLKEVEKIEEK